MANLLFLFETIFSLWLLLDALRRKASWFWILMILLPFGELVYFFRIKILDPEMAGLRATLGFKQEGRVSMAPLREALREVPSLNNTLALALALEESGDFEESALFFRQALRLDGNSKEALYGLGEALAGAEQFDEAVTELEALIALDPSFRDYAAWAHLIRVLWNQGKKEDALERLAQLVRLSPRLSHRVFYAHYLRQNEQHEEAAQQLSLGLEEYEGSPSFLQGRHEEWARQARQMLREVGSERSRFSSSPV